MAHYDECVNSGWNFVRLSISLILLALARLVDFIKEFEVVTDFFVKLFQMGAYCATIGMFIFTIIKYLKNRK